MMYEKICQNGKQQILIYDQIRNGHKPNPITLVGNKIRYPWINGVACDYWKRIWVNADFAMWQGHPKRKIDRKEYYNYILSQAPDSCHDALALLQTVKLTPVRVAHGNLIMENTIDTPEGVIFINPRSCHGLNCREIDEALFINIFKPVHHLLLLMRYICKQNTIGIERILDEHLYH